MEDNRSEYKGYLIRPCRQFPSQVEVQVVGRGGKIPNSLTGLFTSRTAAMEAIDTYVRSK